MLEVLKPTLSTPLQSAGAAALHPLTLTDLRKAGSVIGWRQETMEAVMVVEEQDTEQTVIDYWAAQNTLSATGSSPKDSDHFVVGLTATAHSFYHERKKRKTFANLLLFETHGVKTQWHQCTMQLTLAYFYTLYIHKYACCPYITYCTYIHA